jgi:aminodeoxyfutalosine synthase
VTAAPAPCRMEAMLRRRPLESAGLADIRDKVLVGERLSSEDGARLYACEDINALGHLANFVRERLHGDRTYFVRNIHLNYTNVCASRCLFCAFHAKEGGAEPYVLTPDDLRSRLEEFPWGPLREVHIVGGVNPDLPYSYYLDLLRSAKQAQPQAHVKAFTMVELAQIRRAAGKPMATVLKELKQAGLDCCPGGGAEVFSARVRAALFPRKPTANRWLQIARIAHRVGVPGNATMLYGHIETPKEKVQHLIRLRALQDETHGFQAFVPLAFHPEKTGLAHLPAPTGLQDLREIAVARLMLDNFPHIKAYWVMLSVEVAQVALWYGADDVDGTIVQEQIAHSAGARTPAGLRREELIRRILEAGRRPVERDGLYREVEDGD